MFIQYSSTAEESTLEKSLLSTYNYTVFGLEISSDIECAECLSGADEKFDVRIRLEAIPEQFVENEDWDLFWKATPEYFFLTVKGVGKYLVTNGDTILVENAADAITPDLRVFLFGTCMGVILHQRKILPIHGSGVVVNNSCIIFSGEIGAGKSTLASSFLKRGAKIIADDVCSVTFTDHGSPIVHPGYAQVKLCSDAAAHFNIVRSDYSRVSSYSDKLHIRVMDKLQKSSLPVTAIYFLEKYNQLNVKIREVTGAEKFFYVNKNIYRKSLIRGLSRVRAHFENNTRFVGKVPMFQICRPGAGVLTDDLVNRVEEHLQL